MLAKKKNSKYYIHLILYLIIIILLSVSLTGPWIDTEADSRYGSINFQFNVFRVKSVTKINILKILLDYFDILYTSVSNDGASTKTIYSKNDVDNIPNEVKNNLRPIITKIDEEFNKLNIKNIRNESVDKSVRFKLIDIYKNNDILELIPKKYKEEDTIFSDETIKQGDKIMSLTSSSTYNSPDDITFYQNDVVKLTDNSTIVADGNKQEAVIKFIHYYSNKIQLDFDRSLGTVVEQKPGTNTIIKLKKRGPYTPNVSVGKILKVINSLFNVYRAGDEVFFENENIDIDEKAKRVKSGELKKDIKTIQDLVRKYSLIIQIILICSIVLLGIHFFLVLFKGRREGIFRFSGIITVFLPLLIIILFIVIFFIISILAPQIMTIYYKLYAIAAFMLIAAFILGLIKII
tara:strand:- start:2795 stop:4009 length:1215 start_codon:yes stop_codon:yes gene_type:complete